MSISISKAELDALGELGEQKDNAPVKLTVLQKILVQYASQLQDEIEINLKSKKVTASGRLRDSITQEIDDDGNTIRILIADYYDYPNKGVKGVKSSSKAPSSPYKYKTFGMNARGRASIKEYIQEGRSKITSVGKDKALGIGLERKGVRASKGVSAIDSKVNTAIYLIKAYGIKTTNYFDDAFNKVFKNFAVTAAGAVGRDIVIIIQTVNTGK